MAIPLIPLPQAVRKIRRARQMSREALAVEANLEIGLVESVEQFPTELTKKQTLGLARAMAVPVHYLFSDTLLVDENVPDFRTAGNKPAVLTSSALNRIARTRSILQYLTDSTIEQDDKFSNVGVVSLSDEESAVRLLRTMYVPVTRGDGSVDPVQTFRETRVSFEKHGIIVLCDKVNDAFRGYCFAARDQFPIVFINTAGQRPATKLFTLMHEAVHVLLGLTGVSDPSIVNNKVERFCNSVAAAVMMPPAEFGAAYRTSGYVSVRAIATLLARRFGASKHAVALRVSELGLDPQFYSKWSAALPPNIPPIEEEDEDEEAGGGGGGISSQIARFGYLLPGILTSAVTARSISPFDAYRLTNLKPSTIAAIADRAANRLRD